MSKKKNTFKGVLPEKFERHYNKITQLHRFDVKLVDIEYVEACAAAFEEAKRDDLIKNEDGKKKKNKYKNRFRDVIPYDYSRVRLEKIGDDESTDYINASWVHDVLYDFLGETERKKTYISAMGPIHRVSDYEAENVDTSPDFWRMVWEQGVEVIVMLTKLSEDMSEMEKCSQYWPNVGKDKDYKGITVITDSEEEVVTKGEKKEGSGY